MMLTVNSIELSRTFVGSDFKNLKYATRAKVSIGARYNETEITLTDEQTAKAVALILDMIRESISVALDVPRQADDEPAAVVAEVPALQVAA